ncbi:acetate--CoA ligase [bacterium]|nr:acetate--CoA ligase [bacterium]
MYDFGPYEKTYKEFNWDLAKEFLEYKEGDPLNIGWYCSDRICQQGKAQKIAMIWEGFDGEVRKYSFNDLRLLSNTYAHYLKGLGIKPGDRVCIFMDKIPDLYISFLGILKLGAIAQPLFSAFGEEALFTRMDDADSIAVITTRKHFRKVRRIKDQLPHLKHIIVVDDENVRLEEREKVFILDKAERVEDFNIYPTNPESPSVLHYTSGTTGKPKGALHVHASIFAQSLSSKWVLDLKDEDIYWCTADPGWVTGTSYGIIGPWSLGITQVVYCGGFGSEKWYKLMEKFRVSVWYTAPTAIRMLMKDGTDLVKQHDLSALRYMCSVGEPLNPEAVHWGIEAFDMPFYDTYWQTETGAIVITNFPGMKVKPGSMGRAFPGITAVVLDLKSYEVIREPNKVGLIALKPGWPSMMREYWNNPTVYQSKFINGWYITGDRSSIDSEGYFWFVGRDDDVINTAGHLVGPFEIESALIEHEAVAEAAAVGKPDPVNMEVVKAFVALKPGFEGSSDLELSIMNFIRKKLSPLAMPQEIEFVDKLPKTRSGKIMRRLLRAMEWGEEIGDTSTLEDD